MSLLVLPSALNVPQSNPAQTLEFAPVLPEDDAPPPADAGNLETLGLGSSSNVRGDTLGAQGPGAAPPDAPLPPGLGGTPVSKRCVGNPPRQTEDPMAPPCVAHFEGDNGGATHEGVTGEEIRVVIVRDASSGPSSRGMEFDEYDTWHDLSEPPAPDDQQRVRAFKAYVRHFNARYQTYGRTVHAWLRFTAAQNDAERTPESRRAEAAQISSRVRPFAVINDTRTNGGAFAEAAAELGMMVFQGTDYATIGRSEAFYARYPGLSWSYQPSLERRAALFVTYVCEKVVGHAVSFSGDATDHGLPRVLGLLRNAAVGSAAQVIGEEVRTGLQACGAEIELDRTYDGSDSSQPVSNTAAFAQAGVTTILFATPSEYQHSHAAAAIGYYPEWVLAGDDTSDRTFQGRLYDQREWTNARNVSIYPSVTDLRSHPCAQAYREGDPEAAWFDVKNIGCPAAYASLRHLFTGIQVAGPNLTPRSMEAGFRAIPAIPSSDPSIPACYYLPGDYTCVKDAQAQWWDPNGQPRDHGGTGCWRMMESGHRYLAGQWPPGDVEAQRTPDDPCNWQGADVT